MHKQVEMMGKVSKRWERVYLYVERRAFRVFLGNGEGGRHFLKDNVSWAIF